MSLLSLVKQKVDPHMIAKKYASRPDLRDQPILDPDWLLYTDGTSLMKQGQPLGYAVVTEEIIVKAGSLPLHWSAQRAKLHPLIRALQLSKGKKTNIYTDSRYAFMAPHSSTLAWKIPWTEELGMLQSMGSRRVRHN